MIRRVSDLQAQNTPEMAAPALPDFGDAPAAASDLVQIRVNAARRPSPTA